MDDLLFESDGFDETEDFLVRTYAPMKITRTGTGSSARIARLAW